MSKCQLCSAKCASWLSSEGQFTLMGDILAAFHSSAEVEGDFGVAFLRIVATRSQSWSACRRNRIRRNGDWREPLRGRPKYRNSASTSPCECALPGGSSGREPGE